MPLTSIFSTAPSDYGRDLSLKELIQAEKASRSLYEFSKQAWPVLEPATPYKDGWHLQAIAEHLEACIDGRIRNLVINVPPRHSKSLTTAVFWTAWAWTRYPHIKWLFSSYALSLSMRDNRRCRQLIMSDWYQKRWGHIVSFSKNQNSMGRFENTASGYRLAVSVESSATGHGGDIICADDAISARDSYSANARNSANLWWDTTMSTRINSPATGVKVIIMQRLNEDDLTGHVLEQGGYTHLMLPSEFEPERKCFTSIGFEDPRTEPGELLWPQQMPQFELDKLKKVLGPIGFASQFQQNPVPGGGAIFKSEWFQYFSQDAQFYILHGQYGERRVVKSECWKFATVDLAASKSSTADYTVIMTWAVTPKNDLLLLEVIRDRYDGGQIEQALQSCYYRHFHTFLVIEKVGMQLLLVQKAIQMGLPVQGYQPMKDKVSRAISASTFYANGKVFHEQFAPYLTELEKEMLTFPMGAHDDQVDTVSMGVEKCFDPAQPNIRNLDDEEIEERVLVKTMERGRDYDWGDF
jgi:predicted phage terminase large subunit-like protein